MVCLVWPYTALGKAAGTVVTRVQRLCLRSPMQTTEDRQWATAIAVCNENHAIFDRNWVLCRMPRFTATDSVGVMGFLTSRLLHVTMCL